MEIKIRTGELDYTALIKNARGLIKSAAETSGSKGMKLVAGILDMPGDISIKMIDALSQETKDDIVNYLFNKNKEKLICLIQDSLKEKGFEISVEDIEISFE